jgi:hypothetical protein
MAYPTRIRIRNVSDTRYGCFLKYPCFVEIQYAVILIELLFGTCGNSIFSCAAV